MDQDPKLLEYATERQKEYFKAIQVEGNSMLAAVRLGVSASTVRDSMSQLRKAAARKGYSPDHAMTKTVPDGFMVKGVSTYYDKEGNPTSQWVKSSIDHDRQQEIMRAAFDAMAQDLPKLKPVKAPNLTNSKLANLYTLTDSHVGMLSSKVENLDALGDWNLQIAEKTLTDCFSHMVYASPRAQVGIVAQLGDWLHSDGLEAKTPTSGHLLDQDGRFPQVVAAAVRILRQVIGFALNHHEKVVVLLAEGNHDLASSVWLRVMFKALYENEPRVEVIDSELPYYVYQHGSVMLGWHHGHIRKNDQLPILFASQYPTIWGATKKRYVHTGHRHHVEEKEHSGVTVIQHSTMAPRDAYAARGGWMSERQCTAITYHKDYGQVCRNTVTPEMLKGIELAA